MTVTFLAVFGVLKAVVILVLCYACEGDVPKPLIVVTEKREVTMIF